NTLFIEYETREPIAFLEDFKNTAIDFHGYIFPFKPFFSPKQLPKIYLGLSAYDYLPGIQDKGIKWGKSLSEYRLDIALKIYRLLMEYKKGNERTEIIKIDTSKAFDLSYGQREIVVILEEYMVQNEDVLNLVKNKRMLRLSTERFSQELANYFV